MVCCLQIELGLRAAGDEVSDELRALLVRKFSGGFGTQAVDDFNNEQENSRPIRSEARRNTGAHPGVGPLS